VQRLRNFEFPGASLWPSAFAFPRAESGRFLRCAKAIRNGTKTRNLHERREARGTRADNPACEVRIARGYLASSRL
jgi:hypothetical protein